MSSLIRCPECKKYRGEYGRDDISQEEIMAEELRGQVIQMRCNDCVAEIIRRISGKDLSRRWTRPPGGAP
jgi:hypothetical protein